MVDAIDYTRFRMSTAEFALGSFELEWTTIQRLLKFTQREGFEVVGNHYEIYLNDPMRTEKSKLKTILRYSI